MHAGRKHIRSVRLKPDTPHRGAQVRTPDTTYEAGDTLSPARDNPAQNKRIPGGVPLACGLPRVICSADPGPGGIRAAEVQPMRFLLCVVLATLVADVAEAQDRPAPPRPSPDFLFQRPEGSVTVRGSWVFARGGSDWYDFVTDQLTLEPNDFNSPAIG